MEELPFNLKICSGSAGNLTRGFFPVWYNKKGLVKLVETQNNFSCLHSTEQPNTNPNNQ